MRPRPCAALVLGLVAAACGGEPEPAAPAAVPADAPHPATPASAEDPAPAPAETPCFVEDADGRGLRFVHRSGHDRGYLMPEVMGGGAALFDADGDGDLDAYLVQSGSLVSAEHQPGNQLFRNDGAGRFEDVTAESGADDRGYGMGVACGDVDNDGDVDLLVTNVGPNALLANDGGGRFADVTQRAGVGDPGWGTSAAFLDYDRDGWLDLYVVNYLNWTLGGELPCVNNLSQPDYCSPKVYELPSRDLLYHNRGDGTLADVTEPSGIGAGFGTGLGVGCGDFDEDGWIDVFVANDGMPDHLWANGGERSPGRFEDVAGVAGCAVDESGARKAGMGVALADVDENGLLDVLVCNLNRETDSLYLNQGGFFQDRTSRAGLAVVSKTFTRFGMAWLDFDNDGVLDLYQANGRVNRQATSFTDDPYEEPNLLFRGIRADGDGPRFEEVLPRGGTRELLYGASRAAAFGDVDGDGGLDVLVVNRDAAAHLFLNRAGLTGGWIVLRVVEPSGRDALGATVRFGLGDRRLRRDVRAAYSYLASNDPRVHVGLGPAREVTDVVVQWPDGEEEAFGTLRAGAVHTLERGDGRPLEER